MKRICHIHWVLTVLIMSPHGDVFGKAEGPEKRGNFLLPTSQQAGPLYGFGQNIVDKGDLLFFVNIDQISGRRRNLTEILPSVLYGISDKLSLFVTIPFTPTSHDGSYKASGINDVSLQLGYAYFTVVTTKSVTQATFVGNFTLPTGSAQKVPNTGFGSPSVFLGTTLSYTVEQWAIWIQGGAVLTTPHRSTKIGNQFLYQGGIEWCLSAHSGWIVALMVEGFGIYSQRNSVCGIIDQNSGGNIFWIGPSVWVSSEKVLLQIGFAVPPVQHLFGIQNKDKYFFEVNCGYKF